MSGRRINWDVVRALEKKLMSQGFGDKSYEIMPGSGNVILSAPHSVCHRRHGAVKQAEYMSGVLVQLLNSQNSCHGIFKTAQTDDDPSYDIEHPYKDAIVDLVRKYGIDVLLDLHIMSDKHSLAVDLGTGHGRNLNAANWLTPIIEERFRANDIQPLGLDQIFCADWPGTVSASVARIAGIACIQIELNWRLLNLNSPEQKVENVLRALFEIVNTINKMKREAKPHCPRDFKLT